MDPDSYQGRKVVITELPVNKQKTNVKRHAMSFKESPCRRMHTIQISITYTKHLTPHLGVTAVSASCWVATLSMSRDLVVEPSSMEEGGEYSDLLRVQVARAEETTNVLQNQCKFCRLSWTQYHFVTHIPSHVLFNITRLDPSPNLYHLNYLFSPLPTWQH